MSTVMSDITVTLTTYFYQLFTLNVEYIVLFNKNLLSDLLYKATSSFIDRIQKEMTNIIDCSYFTLLLYRFLLSPIV
jgi:hypothetical protein